MMDYLVHVRKASLVLALAFAIATPGALLAQGQDVDTGSLTLQDVKDRLKENQKHLDQARERGKAGDAAGMETALQNYERGNEGLNRALDQGRLAGDANDREQAYDRVEKATRKHSQVLTDLLASGKIPEQARPHVEHALQVSQKGRQTALANLQQARSQRSEQEAAQRRQGLGQSSVSGRPEGAGRPGGSGGPPSGVSGGSSGAPGAGHASGRGPH